MSHSVIAVVDDMFFASKIRATAEASGVEISFARNKEAVIEKVRETKPALVVIDLHNQKVDPVDLAADLKADEQTSEIPLVGFFSHVHTDLQKNALAAGFDHVLPRSVFSRDLPQILSAPTTLRRRAQ
jgi:CheY-like chemotaxis protein